MKNTDYFTTLEKVVHFTIPTIRTFYPFQLEILLLFGGGGGGRITIIIIITWEAEDVSIGSSADGELNQNGIISVTWQFQIVRLIGYYCLVLFLSASEPSLNFGNSKVAYEPVPGIQIVRGRQGQSKESKKKQRECWGEPLLTFAQSKCLE